MRLFKTLLLTGFLSPLFLSPALAENKSTEATQEDIEHFSSVIHQIKRFYVKPTGDKELLDHAIRGMVSGLDPHSSYLDKKDYKELQEISRGEFGGLGIEVTMEDGYVKVISPIDDTPAARAGLKAGDLIVKLDKKSVKGMKLKEAVAKMRGKKGTSIKLTVVREGEIQPLFFTIKRAIVQVKSVKDFLLEDKYGYVRISHFQEPTARLVTQAVKALSKKAGGKLSGLILDLRNNPGGLLNSAIEISDAFIHNDEQGDEELIVYTKGRVPGSQYIATASPGDVLKGAPIVVLINQGSASGSEIVAGALQDHKRALLIGTRSFGKGSVQTVIPLDEDRGLKLTTSLYYTPAGRSIQAKGIKPDITVEHREMAKKDDKAGAASLLSEAALKNHITTVPNNKKAKNKAKNAGEKLLETDHQLYQALNILKGLAALHK